MHTVIKAASATTGTQAPDNDIAETVARVIADVRADGDSAVRAYSQKFDDWSPRSFRLSDEEIAVIVAGVPQQVIDDIREVQRNVRAFAQLQRESLVDFEAESALLHASDPRRSTCRDRGGDVHGGRGRDLPARWGASDGSDGDRHRDGGSG